jgi:hypothetical protein
MIEFNLVKTQGMFSPVYTLLMRKRINIDTKDNAQILQSALDFLKENHDTLVAALSDQDFVEKIMAADSTTMDEFMSIKYILTQSGLDVLVNEVAELEINPEDIEEGTNEYSLIDNLTNGTFKLATKVVLPDESSNLSMVYEKLTGLYNFFNTPVTSNYRNPLTVQLGQLKRIEETVGVASTQITSYINSVLEYLGKSIILITNE